MKSANPAMPIPMAELMRHSDYAASLLANVQWRPVPAARRVQPKPAMAYRESPALSTQEIEVASLLKAAGAVGTDKVVIDEAALHVVIAVRDGIRIGMHLSETYQKQVGLIELMQKNKAGQLQPAQVTEFQQKLVTAAAVALFTTSYYAVWKLSRYRAEEVGSVPIELNAIPEISTRSPPDAYQCALFYLTRLFEGDQVKSGPGAVKMAILYFEKVIDELKLRVPSLLHSEPFTNASYKLENEEFAVTGFESEISGVEVSVAFNPTSFDQIVGNRDAKHNARRLIQRLVSFDREAKKNPFSVFGELPRVRMGKGIPGTGKSLQIAATATELDKVGKQLGHTVLFWPLPDDIFDEFQGKSAKKMLAWMKVLADPTKLIYAPIDDAENTLKDRSAPNVSEAVEGVNAVFLRWVEGAYAPNYGNSAIELYTNLPEKLDPASLSRVHVRFDVDGAQTIEDFLDQDYLWWSKLAEKIPGLIDMAAPKGHTFLANQGELSNLSELYAHEPVEPQGEILRRIFEEVRKDHREDEQIFYGKLFEKIRKEFPKRFSSRDVRNIQVGINNRLTDFDLPKDWLEKRDLFVGLPYDRKVQMLLDRQKECLKGLSFKTVRLQETVRYLNVSLSIAENARRREIERLVEQTVVSFHAHEEAKALLAKTGHVMK